MCQYNIAPCVALQHRAHLGCALLARTLGVRGRGGLALALGGRAALDGGRALLQRGQLGAACAQRRLQPGDATAGSVAPGAQALALCMLYITCTWYRPGSQCEKAGQATLPVTVSARRLAANAQQHASPAWTCSDLCRLVARVGQS